MTDDASIAAAARSLIQAAEGITADAATIDAYIDAFPLTPERARMIDVGGGWSCACVGPPAALRHLPDAPCWCTIIAEKIRRTLG